MTYTATTAQIWHEMQRQRTGTGCTVVFRLQKDPDASPYRYRGVAVFGVSVALSWMSLAVAVIEDDGRPWRPTWQQFASALPELASASPYVSINVVIEEADAVAWAPSASRDAKRTTSMSAARATWPSQIEAIRAEWLPRRKTDRRTGYLAAADALAMALEFDQARGAA